MKMRITITILIGLDTFFLLSQRIIGRNNKAMNIEKIRGIKIKDSSLSR
jgi:hypothetical protein